MVLKWLLWLRETADMPATLGGQWTIIGGLLAVAGTILWVSRRLLQYIELVTKTILIVARSQGTEIPTWLADQYKKVNGHAKATREEKNDLLGKEHNSDHKHQSARTLGLVDDEEVKK